MDYSLRQPLADVTFLAHNTDPPRLRQITLDQAFTKSFTRTRSQSSAFSSCVSPSSWSPSALTDDSSMSESFPSPSINHTFTSPPVPPSKRPRLEPPSAHVLTSIQPHTSRSWMTCPSAHLLVNARSSASPLALRAMSRHAFSVTPYISSFASHNDHDVYHCSPSHDSNSPPPPFACAFTSAFRAGNDKFLLAVADERGGITFIDPDRETSSAVKQSFVQAHSNAIFDLKFSADDTMLATGSADQTCRVFSSRTGQQIAHVLGHSGSIRHIAWDPLNSAIISSASRDGSICIWDLRTESSSPANKINNAHGTKVRSKRPPPRTVTSVIHLPSKPGLLASSGSADGVVRFWDLRRSMSKRVNPPYLDESNDFESMLLGESLFSPVSNTSSNRNSSRTHGISCLTLSEQNGRIYALTTDSNIVAHSTAPGHLQQNEPLQVFSSPSDFKSTTFYVRLDSSPCGRFLVSGSSSDSIWIWDTQTGKGEPVSLHGHSGEVGSVAWGNRDTIASAGDDTTVRVWKYQEKLPQKFRDGEEKRWNWSGAWIEDDDE